MKSNYKISLNMQRYYNAHVKNWFDGMISRKAENFSKHNFRNVRSLLKVELIDG